MKLQFKLFKKVFSHLSIDKRCRNFSHSPHYNNAKINTNTDTNIGLIGGVRWIATSTVAWW